MQTDTIKLLMLEDNADDALLIQATFKKAATLFNIRHVSDKKGFIEALDSFCPAIILSDHQLPQFNSIEALSITREKCPHVPFIIVTGTVSDEFAATIIKSGADDYILKDRLTRLPGAIDAALKQRQAEEELKRTHKENKQLADRMSAIINTLPANIALLDEKGIIVEINDSWRSFADINGFIGSNYGIGSNYINLSRNADGEKVAEGIEAVLHHQVKEFVFEYACHSNKIERWFRMVASPLLGKEYTGAVVMHIDISELRKLEQERLQAKIAEQKMLSQAVIMGQEIERNHISQELHDNINQLLIGSKMYLNIAGNKSEMVKQSIKYPVELIDNTIEEIRLLCRNLVTPVKNIKLEELVQVLLLNINEVSKAKTSFTYCVKGKPISDDIKLNIYRILQEQVNNILKHAEAKNVTVSILAEDGIIAIIVEDDGKGFDTEKKRNGVGISNMINRIGIFDGEIAIQSSIGNGCTIKINIPY